MKNELPVDPFYHLFLLALAQLTAGVTECPFISKKFPDHFVLRGPYIKKQIKDKQR